MKKVLMCLAGLAIIACKQEPKDYATFSGKIENANSDSLFVFQSRNYKKTIKVNEDGTFSDTLKVNPGVYGIYDGKEQAFVYLKNDADIKLSVDAENFRETIKYEGKDVENSNFLVEKARFESGLIDLEALKNLDSLGFEKKLESLKSEMMAFYDKNKNIDSSIIATSKSQINPMLMSIKRYVGESIKLRSQLPKGSESPSFNDYENYAGGTTSLEDLKGKYVYIDVWATWCAPCKVEIPSLKKLDEDYKDKNITFVSISIDDARAHKGSMEKANEAWKAMVADKELTGVQLFAPNGWQSDFIKDYKINGIPRFILIDPEGKIVTPDAPRPSDEQLRTLLDTLNI